MSRHIALVIATMNGGGAQRVMADLANHWSQCGHRVSLITLSGPQQRDTYPLDKRIERRHLNVSAGSLGAIGACVRLRRLLRKLDPHAVVSFIDSTNVLSILATRGLRARVVVSERTDPAVNPTVTRVWRFLRRLTYRFADSVVAQTTPAAAWLREHCSVVPVVIPNAIRDLHPPGEPRRTLIVAAGRLDWHKGFDVVLRAFATGVASFPEWRLAILGTGPQEAALVALSQELGIESKVEFAGDSRNIEEWFSRAAILVHASRFEGFPNVILEAMALGAAVVATDCRSGPADIIQDGINGRLVPVDDSAAVADAVAGLIADPKTRNRLAEEAQRVRERYAMRRISQQWNLLLDLPPTTFE